MLKWMVVLSLACTLSGESLYPQTPRLVRDIVTGGDVRSSKPRHFVSTGELAFFMAEDQNGRELWRSDGTPEGTRMVRELAPGAWSLDESYDPGFIASGDLVYFWIEAGFYVHQLWRTDGTSAGTFPLTQHLVDEDGDPLFGRGEVAPFGERGAIFGDGRLFVTDGTVEGTRLMTDAFDVDYLTRAGAYVYVSAHRDLWRSDGTVAGTTHVTTIDDGTIWSFERPVAAGDAIYFIADSPYEAEHYHVYRSDGTASGTVRVKSFAGENRPRIVVVGTTPFLLVELESTTEIWRIDTEVVRTTVVEGTRIRYLRWNADHFFFTTEGEYDATTVWSSDGTAAGTRAIFSSPVRVELMGTTASRLYMKIDDRDGDLYPVGTLVHEIGGDGVTQLTPASYEMHYYGYVPIAAMGERVVFPAEDDEYGEELWMSDGTPSGTRRFNIHHDHNSWGWLAQRFGNSILFRAIDENGAEPWISDGTAAGTRLLRNVAPDGENSHPARFTDLGNGRAIFFADHPDFGREVWATDGTSAGTSILPQIHGWGHYDTRDPFVVLNGRAFLFSSDQVWTTDGTYDGTTLLKAVDGSVVGKEVAAGGLVYFIVYDSLWRSDGTAAGTFPIASLPRDLVASGNRVFFVAAGQAHGLELWVTDGTLAGTHIVKDIRPGTAGAFYTNGDANGWWLHGIDGGVMFSADDGVHGLELWRSDGTEAGTVLVRDIASGSSLLAPVEGEITASIGNVVYFPANDGVHGVELWRSDGTAEGTRLVRDVAFGAAWSYPTHFRAIGGRVYFSADDDVHGRELWWTSDTGTMLVADLAPGPTSSTPRDMIAVGDSVFFFATTEATGDEPWIFEPRTVKRRSVTK